MGITDCPVCSFDSALSVVALRTLGYWTPTETNVGCTCNNSLIMEGLRGTARKNREGVWIGGPLILGVFFY